MAATGTLNMDLDQRVFVDTASADWIASPAAGVWRKPLEREAAESGRTTSLVRFELDASFPAHRHPMGEEIYVIRGAFEDEFGVYPAGSYLRNPPDSRHTPGCRAGCEIFVKLDQFHPRDMASVRRDTRRGDWLRTPSAGITRKPLHRFEGEEVMLEAWQPGATVGAHVHRGGEEILVLAGELCDEHGRYPAGSWLRQPIGSEHAPFTEQGCRLLVKSGHLGPRADD